jgi:hypothetical protein
LGEQWKAAWVVATAMQLLDLKGPYQTHGVTSSDLLQPAFTVTVAVIKANFASVAIALRNPSELTEYPGPHLWIWW